MSRVSLGRKKRENKQEGQLLSIKRVLNASQSASFGNGELLKILERGTEMMKVEVLGRETGQMIKPHEGWRQAVRAEESGSRGYLG